MSTLRLVGLLFAVLAVLALLLGRRSGRLLRRREVLAFAVALLIGTLAIEPSLANGLVRLTGLTGDLSRIVSLLLVAVGVLGVLNWTQADALQSTHLRLLAWMRASTASAVPEGQGASILVIMPALNEADNLPSVLARAPREIAGHAVQLLVVDDGSSDGTAQIARDHGALSVRSLINAGGGHALQVGFEVARRTHARWAVTMDADGQHRFEDLPTMMAPLLEGKAEVVIGSRNLGESIGHERFRAVGLKIFNWILSVLTGRRITDCSSGYRAFDLAALSRLQLVQDRHHTAELIIEAVRKGLRVVEVPIVIQPRLFGESKKGTNWLYGFRFARTVLASWWR